MFVMRALTVLAAAAATAFAAKVDVSILPTENLSEDVTPLPVPPMSYQHLDSGNYRRQAVLGRAFYRTLVAQAGHPFLDPPRVVESANANGVDIVDGITVQSTHLFNTSIAHVDKIVTGEPVPAGSRIAFIMLNTNDRAHFDVDGQCIPVVQGSLVTFDGSHTHQTVVRRGNVDLVGPFQISTMASVGIGIGFDPCVGTLCQNGGTCSAGVCSCLPGYIGQLCEVVVDLCGSITCQNGGICSAGICNCPSGFSGPNCEIDTACVGTVCLNGGTCSSGVCTCVSGYTGSLCMSEVDPCDSITCFNGGTCSAGICSCPSGYLGPTCGIDMCVGIPCQNGGTCSSGVCTCVSGYTGAFCTIEVDPCDSITCQNGGICSAGICSCVSGYSGPNCEIDTACIGTVCQNGGTCSSGVCTCVSGYTGSLCMSEVDPCDSITCQNGGTCSEGVCSCVSGYVGPLCDIDKCVSDSILCENGGTCSGGVCICEHGYTGEFCEVPSSSGGGDPHFRTFGNTFFSYHGACDLKLLESLAFANRKGLRVIIRTTYAETQSAQYSYISGVVVQVGEHTFEVESDGSSYLDGELIHESRSAAIAAPATEHADEDEDEDVPADKIVSGYKKDTKHLAATGDNTPVHVHLEGIPVTKFSKGKRGNIVTFELKAEGKAVQIRARKDILSVDVSGLFDDAVGLLGTSGQPGMIGRDKFTNYDADWLKYGEEWQIREDEPMLFRRSRFPQHPQKCSYDVDVVAAHGRRLRGIVESEEPVSVEAATEACSGVQDEHMRQFCVDDVMAMGLDMASDPFFSN